MQGLEEGEMYQSYDPEEMDKEFFNIYIYIYDALTLSHKLFFLNSFKLMNANDKRIRAYEKEEARQKNFKRDNYEQVRKRKDR